MSLLAEPALDVDSGSRPDFRAAPPFALDSLQSLDPAHLALHGFSATTSVFHCAPPLRASRRLTLVVSVRVAQGSPALSSLVFDLAFGVFPDDAFVLAPLARGSYSVIRRATTDFAAVHHPCLARLATRLAPIPLPVADCSASGHLPGLPGALRRLLVRPCPLANHSISTCGTGHHRMGWACLPTDSPDLAARLPNSPLDRVSGRIVLGSPPFRGFSPFVPLGPLGPSFPPCSLIRPRGRGASRISAWCLTSGRPYGHPLASIERQRSHPGVLFTRSCGRSSPGCFPPPRITVAASAFAWRPRRSAFRQLGVRSRSVFPRSSSLGLLSRRRASPVHHPETVFLVGPAPRALFRVSEIRSADPKSSGPPPWGFVRLQPCTACAVRLLPFRVRIRWTVGPRGRALGRHPRETLPHFLWHKQVSRHRIVTRLSQGLGRGPLSSVFHKEIHSVRSRPASAGMFLKSSESRTIIAWRHALVSPSTTAAADPSTGSPACRLRSPRSAPAARGAGPRTRR